MSLPHLTRRSLLGMGAAGLIASRRGAFGGALTYPPESVVQDDPLFRLPTLEPLDDYFLTTAERSLPCLRRWDFGLRGGIDCFGTTESVGDGVASRYVFTAAAREAAGGPGVMLNQDSAVYGGALSTYAGISFWVKGDGSTAKGLFGWNQFNRQPFEFPLDSTEWRKVFARWEDFNAPITSAINLPSFSLRDPEDGRDHHYVIDRMRYFQDAITETIEPTPRADLDGDLPAAMFLGNLQGVETAHRELWLQSRPNQRSPRSRGRRPPNQKYTVVVVGDSIADGAQLFYVYGGRVTGQENAWRRRREYAYGGVAGDAVAQAFGFDTANVVHETFQGGAWERGYGDDPGHGLNWIVLGMPGRPTASGVDHLDRILSYQPNLVIYNLGVNDMRNRRSIDSVFTPNIETVVEASKRSGADVALCTPYPTGDVMGWGRDPFNHSTSIFALSFGYVERMRELAATHNCALIDFHSAFLARGVHALGELYADGAHANHVGHELMATLVTELLAREGRRIWTRGKG